MKKRFLAVIVRICCLVFLARTSFAADEITDPILKKLVEKGILTKEEASSVMKDIDQEAVKAEQKVEQTIDKKVTDVQPTENKDVEKVVNAMKGFKFGLLSYLSYQNGETGDLDNGSGYSQFTIKRGYFRVTKELLPWFEAHTTFDVTTIKDPEEAGDPGASSASACMRACRRNARAHPIRERSSGVRSLSDGGRSVPADWSVERSTSRA